MKSIYELMHETTDPFKPGSILSHGIGVRAYESNRRST